MISTGATIRDLVGEFGGLVHALDGLRSQRGELRRPLAMGDPRLARRPADVHIHSGRIRGGEVFAALPGLAVDGWRFAPDAVQRGAAVVLAGAERTLHSLEARLPGPAGTLLWLHPRAAEIVGQVASRVHGEPSRTLRVGAVTGTNGKTSACHFVHQMLAGAGVHGGVLGTAGHTIMGPRGPLQVEATHTTPDATEVQRLLARHRGGGGTSLVMEASSHALVQGRLAGVHLAAAGFTNLTPEHLDYHGSMERYLEAKARLWQHLVPGGVAAIFGHSRASQDMARLAAGRGARVVTVDVDAPADVMARGLRTDARGTTFELVWPGRAPETVLLPLKGQHNVENALVSAVLAEALGAPLDSILVTLRGIGAPPGRLEPVPVPAAVARRLGGAFEVLVDYAHTEDALRRVLESLRGELDGSDGRRLLCVFGCGGDRDRTKREPMGRAAGRLADVAFVTSDNPRGEDPGRIAGDVLRGVEAEDGRSVLELDRRAAIERSLRAARPGDVVLIAGKGHENTQTIRGEALPFDDRVVAAEVLAAIGAEAHAGGARP